MPVVKVTSAFAVCEAEPESVSPPVTAVGFVNVVDEATMLTPDPDVGFAAVTSDDVATLKVELGNVPTPGFTTPAIVTAYESPALGA